MKELLSKPADIVGGAAVDDLDAGAVRAIGGGHPRTAQMSEQSLRKDS